VMSGASAVSGGLRFPAGSVAIAVMATVTVTAMVVETVMAMAMVAIRQRQHLTHQMCRLLPV
ncbi:hypothetical protein, partial [Citrobacter freundii]|uniref:hypothetical protein n=1 Tax=Citrobacter freundii TaxID=546 RepID=UPI0028A28397